MAHRISGDATELRDVIPTLKHARQSLAYYSSPDALAEHCQHTKKDQCWHESPWTNDAYFTGSNNMREACDLARKGWPEGAERVAKLRDRIIATRPMARQLTRWSVGGAIPNVPRYLAGNPMHLRAIDSAQTKRRAVITLLSNMTANSSVDARCITNRAAVVAAIVDAIESTGYACNLVGFMSTSNDDLHCMTAITLKESHQPADIGRLAYGLGHASMFRRLTWVTLVEDNYTESLGIGLGHATELPRGDLASRGIYIVKSPNNNSSLFSSEDTAATQGLDALIADLAAQGCPAFPEREAAA